MMVTQPAPCVRSIKDRADRDTGRPLPLAQMGVGAVVLVAATLMALWA